MMDEPVGSPPPSIPFTPTPSPPFTPKPVVVGDAQAVRDRAADERDRVVGGPLRSDGACDGGRGAEREAAATTPRRRAARGRAAPRDSGRSPRSRREPPRPLRRASRAARSKRKIWTTRAEQHATTEGEQTLLKLIMTSRCATFARCRGRPVPPPGGKKILLSELSPTAGGVAAANMLKKLDLAAVYDSTLRSSSTRPTGCCPAATTPTRSPDRTRCRYGLPRGRSSRALAPGRGRRSPSTRCSMPGSGSAPTVRSTMSSGSIGSGRCSPPPRTRPR